MSNLGVHDTDSVHRLWQLNRAELPDRAGALVRRALWARLMLSREPVYADIAFAGSLVAMLASARMRRTAAAAVHALTGRASAGTSLRFTSQWWFQRAANGALAYQTDRLTPDWIRQHVSISGTLPTSGCVLMGVHQFSQRLAFARLSMAVDELGAISMFEPHMPDRSDPLLSAFGTEQRYRAHKRFAEWVFGGRVYPPGAAVRGAVDLLRRGGSLVVLSDFLGRDLACVLGRHIAVPNGAIWFAEKSGRAIVPFVLSPDSSTSQSWRISVGEPIAPTRSALVAGVQACIRKSPTNWTGWPGWFESAQCTV